MLTQEDIQKLIEVFATREDMKEMVEVLATREEFAALQTSVDAYAHKADAYFQEMVMLSHKVDRHEKWLQQIAEKLGFKLQY
jgi:GTP-binding protein EngB required for normal cell division